MGSRRARNSTGARKALSHKSSRSTQRKPARPHPGLKPLSAAAILGDVRQQLEVAAAVATITSVALRCQRADSDEDAALTLQRCIVDALSRQLEQIDWVIATCRALARKPIANGGAP